MDFKGHGCPDPVIKSLDRLAELKPGETLIVLTDSEKCVELLEDAITSLDLGRISIVKLSGYYKIILERK
jgi:TusA-related sulfurtransferase